MTDGRRTMRARRLRGMLAAIAMVAGGLPAAGQDLGAALDKLGRLVDAAKSGAGTPLRLGADARVAAFLKAVAGLQAIDQKIGQLRASFSFGYSGDRSYSGGDLRDSNHLLNIDTSLVKDRYPSALKFKTSSKLMLGRGGAVQQESSSTLLALNHYIRPFLEVYAFAERFSDSFMSVKQRYETGAGLKFEYTLDPLRNDPGTDPIRALEALTAGDPASPPAGLRRASEKAEQRFLNAFPALEEAFLRALKDAGVAAEDLAAIFIPLETVERTYRRTSEALVKARAPLMLGIAFSAFTEVEQDELSTYYYGATGQKISKSYLLDPEQRFRAVIRPSLEWILADGVVLSSMWYLKLPVGAPYTKLLILDPDNPAQKTRKYDYRIDGTTDLRIAVGRNQAWGGDISLSLEYQFHYDNAPPFLPETLSGATFQGMGLKNAVAASAHHFYMVRLNIGF